ncbi:RNase H family protein [Plantibacter sp. YIM 135347]|uniref:RNase H family protein n=1 Tax=Plantibacter sp. YIM 135347 TaxID=3423919 RepID=UPI003D3577D5
MTIIAAADGSALGNPGPAGWAWYVNDECWAAGGWKHATNNQGELKAVLELFRATAHLDDDLHILCDSQYVINSVTKWMPGWKKKGWKKGDGKPVLNLDLLKEIDEAITGRKYRFEWVKGHVGHVLNEAADTRARAVAEAFQRGSAIPSGPGWTGDAGRVATVSEPGGADAAEAAKHTASAVRFAAGPDADALTSDGADDVDAEPAGGAGGSAATEHSAGSDGSLFAADDVVLDIASATLADDPVQADAQLGTADDDDALFSFDDITEWQSLTLNVTTEEWTRLSRRARERGVSVEEFLRSLI